MTRAPEYAETQGRTLCGTCRATVVDALAVHSLPLPGLLPCGHPNTARNLVVEVVVRPVPYPKRLMLGPGIVDDRVPPGVVRFAR